MDCEPHPEPLAPPPLDPPTTSSPARSAGPFADAVRANRPPVYPGELPRLSQTPPPLIPEPPTPAIGGPGLGRWVMRAAALLSLAFLTLYALPYLLYHWRTVEGRGEAEAAYQKRLAELRAEAEHADERLAVLDKRVHLTSLGFREVVRKVTPWVVNITTYRRPRREELIGGAKLLVRDPEDGQTYIQGGVGSGIILKPGIILTNDHVVHEAERLRITFASGRSLALNAKDIVADALTDLALVRLPADLPAGLRQEADVRCELADSDKDVHVGDWALAVGSPLGLRQTVTQGVISAKGRLLPKLDMVELLQTDAAINPGNSGGPLFDQLGRVIGINVAIASDNGGNQGIGFAIPSNVARRISDQLLDNGEVQRGYLGIAMAELHAFQARGLKADEGAVLIRDVVPNEAADQAGLRAGDLVVGVGREELSRVQPMHHLRRLVAAVEPGQEITLKIVRDGARREFAVKVGKRPANIR
jgi:serine protease Do